MSVCAGFSSGRIRFIPDGGDRDERDYSDRSLVELRAFDNGEYSIRALDIENKKIEIFNIPLKNKNTYKRARSSNDPDEIRAKSGTYRLWLKRESREGFYTSIDSALAEIELLQEGASSSSPSINRRQAQADSSDDQSARTSTSRNNQKQTSKPNNNESDFSGKFNGRGNQTQQSTRRTQDLLTSDEDEPPTRPSNKQNLYPELNKLQREQSPKHNNSPSSLNQRHKSKPVNSSDDESSRQSFGRQNQGTRNANQSTIRGQPKVNSSDDESSRQSFGRQNQSTRNANQSSIRSQPKTNSSDDDSSRQSFGRQNQSIPNANQSTIRGQPKVNSSDDDSSRQSFGRQNQGTRNPNQSTIRSQPKVDSSDDDSSKKPPPRTQAQTRESPKQPNQTDLVSNVYELGKYIRKGETDQAIESAKKLSATRVQLQTKPRDNKQEERPIEVKFKIESNNASTARKYQEFSMDVYPSTTIAELRTTFEYAENFPPSSQYFFVNGHLAHETYTMTDLKVERDTLFILFVIIN